MKSQGVTFAHVRSVQSCVHDSKWRKRTSLYCLKSQDYLFCWKRSNSMKYLIPNFNVYWSVLYLRTLLSILAGQWKTSQTGFTFTMFEIQIMHVLRIWYFLPDLLRPMVVHVCWFYLIQRCELSTMHVGKDKGIYMHWVHCMGYTALLNTLMCDFIMIIIYLIMRFIAHIFAIGTTALGLRACKSNTTLVCVI